MKKNKRKCINYFWKNIFVFYMECSRKKGKQQKFDWNIHFVSSNCLSFSKTSRRSWGTYVSSSYFMQNNRVHKVPFLKFLRMSCQKFDSIDLQLRFEERLDCMRNVLLTVYRYTSLYHFFACKWSESGRSVSYVLTTFFFEKHYCQYRSRGAFVACSGVIDCMHTS